MKRTRNAQLAIAIVSTALLTTSCAGAPPASNFQPTLSANVLQFHSGTRVDQEGTPLLAISGSHYEVGLQYGVLLRPEIRSVHAEFDELLDDLTGGGLRRFFFDVSIGARVAQLRAALPAGAEEELHGMADGSGIRFEDFLFFSLATEILFDTTCTTVVVRRGEELVHGRNFDFFRPASLISRYPVIVQCHVNDEIPYVNVGFIGLAGVYTGLNFNGMAVSVDTAVFVKASTGKVVPVGFLLKKVLESCSSMGEVDALIKTGTASHYLVTVSSRSERTAAVYECFGDEVTKVPITLETLFVANAPLSIVGRCSGASILTLGEYNLAREGTLRRLTAEVPDGPLVDYVLSILGNHDFFTHRDFLVHQTLLQDSSKTINAFGTIQSAVVDWRGNRILFSYGTSYAAFGPYIAYDLSTGAVTLFRSRDPFASQGSFTNDTEFLDVAFTLFRRKGMVMDRDAWEQLDVLLSHSPGLNDFLRNDWRYTVALALNHLAEAESAAIAIDSEYPEYYLGPFDLGIIAYRQQRWSSANGYFQESVRRTVNSPPTKFLALAYASLSCKKAGDDKASEALRKAARSLLQSRWSPPELSQMVGRYISDQEMSLFVRDMQAAR